MAEVYTEPTPSAFGPRPTDPGTPVPLDGDGTTTLDGIAAAIKNAQNEKDRPSMIKVTKIG